MGARPMTSDDLDEVTDLLLLRFARAAHHSPLVALDADRVSLRAALGHVRADVWSDESGTVRAFLAATVVDGPDGRVAVTSIDGSVVGGRAELGELLDRTESSWRARRARRHVVWVFNRPTEVTSWVEQGYEVELVRGVMALSDRPPTALPAGVRVRQGDERDAADFAALSRVIDAAHGEPGRAADPDDAALLADPDNHYLIARDAAGPVAQCLSWMLDARRGSWGPAVHLSAVAVVPPRQRQGLGGIIVDHALAAAYADGARFAEANWRARNEVAASFWTGYGFAPVALRLSRAL